MKKGYIVVQVDVKDPKRYEQYREMVLPTIQKHGGKFLVRGGRVETLEGDWKPSRFVVIEFDSVQKAKDWWDSVDYRPARNLRQQISRAQLILVEGFEGVGG